tara:strand:- start:131 stop:874 length:744 start_codon:yes stop_codon:yes gene_type:complete
MSNIKSKFIYGIHTISNVIRSDDNAIKKIYLKKSPLSKNLSILHQKALSYGLHIETVELDELTLLCDTKKHQGVVCELDQAKLSVFNLNTYLSITESPFILMLDQIKDPNNLGACIRTANAVGCNLVIKRKSNSAPLSPAVHKASCGGTTGISIYESNDLNGILKKLKKHNITVIGTDHRAKSDFKAIKKLQYKGVCVIMGAEDTGISRALKSSCDEIFSIPIYGSIDCLNISVASGIMLYEIAKYR